MRAHYDKIYFTFFQVFMFATAASAQGPKEFSYGPDTRQVLDVYGSGSAANPPIIVMLHGGGWAHGDKRNPDVWRAKTLHWVPKGYLFISVNTRLLPDADPVEQAGDLARAMAFIQYDTGRLGGDPQRIVLMGHSAGAHVAALLATSQDIQSAARLKPWLGTVLLDSAALDVVRIMRQSPSRLHRNAFGSNPAFWYRASPRRHLNAGDGPMLIVCSSKRRQPCPEAARFAARAADISVLPVHMSHAKISRNLGLDSTYTDVVDRWLSGLGLP